MFQPVQVQNVVIYQARRCMCFRTFKNRRVLESKNRLSARAKSDVEHTEFKPPSVLIYIYIYIYIYVYIGYVISGYTQH